MAQHAETSRSLALSLGPRNATRLLPKTSNGSRAFSTAAYRPVQPAEIAQARVFEGLLQTECAELQELARRMAGAKGQLPAPDDSRPTGDLTQIRARIDEVHSLLRALQGRFPHSTPDGDPLAGAN